MKIAIHMLIPYPPSNPNRDELGMPKTATVGGALRQRMSSQSLKRAWRLSDEFNKLDAMTSVRTRAIGEEVQKRIVNNGGNKKLATKVGEGVTSAFGKPDRRQRLRTSEVVILGREEWDAALALADVCQAEAREPTEKELAQLQRPTTSIDVAMFGRMRASTPSLNVDASVSVAHALTTNKIVIEADFWTAVDDLNEKEEDAGAGGMGEREFGSGVYYVYGIVDGDQLTQNLGNNAELANNAVKALIAAMATTTPDGHRNSFAHHSHAAYIAIEIADRVCGNMMLPAFEKPAETTVVAIDRLKTSMQQMVAAYGLNLPSAEMSTSDGEGSLAEILNAIKLA